MDAFIARTHTILTAVIAVGALAFGVALAGASTITVQTGDTLGSLAARHGVTAAALAAANGLTDPDAIVAGRSLVIPEGAAVSSAGPGGAPSPLAASGGYRVAAGDTLGAIAARHGVSVDALARANGLADPDAIVAGDSLTIPGGAGAAPAASGGAASAPAAASGGYRVAAGDTLGAIAARHGVSVDALARANGLADPDAIVAGDSLTIPDASAPAGVPAGWAPADRGAVGAMITSAADRHGVDPALARAVAWQESGWDHAAVSSAGALGVMQLMPDTARWLGADIVGRTVDPRSLADNIDGGVALLGWLQRQTGGDTPAAVAAYYQGLTGVRERGWFDDTKDYVESVLALRGRV